MAKVVGEAVAFARGFARALLPQVTLLRSFHANTRDRKMPNDQCNGQSNTSHRDLVVQGIERLRDLIGRSRAA